MFGGARNPRLGTHGDRPLPPFRPRAVPPCVPGRVFGVFRYAIIRNRGGGTPLERQRHGVGPAAFSFAVRPLAGGECGLSCDTYAFFALPPALGGTAARQPFSLWEEDRKQARRDAPLPLLGLLLLASLAVFGKPGLFAVPPCVPGRVLVFPPACRHPPVCKRAGGREAQGARRRWLWSGCLSVPLVGVALVAPAGRRQWDRGSLAFLRNIMAWFVLTRETYFPTLTPCDGLRYS